MAIAALVLGILACVCLGAIAGVFAIVFGFLGLKKAKEIGTGRGMAIAGLVLGIIGTVLSILLIVLVVVFADDLNEYEVEARSCQIDGDGVVTFEGTVENTGNSDLQITIRTEIRDRDSGEILDQPSTFFYVSEDDTAQWSVLAFVDSGSDVECSVDSVDSFLD